jgi:hypothetical protein
VSIFPSIPSKTPNEATDRLLLQNVREYSYLILLTTSPFRFNSDVRVPRVATRHRARQLLLRVRRLAVQRKGELQTRLSGVERVCANVSPPLSSSGCAKRICTRALTRVWSHTRSYTVLRSLPHFHTYRKRMNVSHCHTLLSFHSCDSSPPSKQ